MSTETQADAQASTERWIELGQMFEAMGLTAIAPAFERSRSRDLAQLAIEDLLFEALNSVRALVGAAPKMNDANAWDSAERLVAISVLLLKAFPKPDDVVGYVEQDDEPEQ